MIRLSWKRKSLIAGAAGICVAGAAALGVAPRTAPTTVRADDTSAARNPNHVLHAAVERELSGLGIDPGPADYSIQPTAGQIPPQNGGQPGFNQQHYQSEVQRQLQMLYQQDGRNMPNMVPVPHVSQEAWDSYQQQHGQLPTSGRRPSRWDWIKPENWRRNWQRTFGATSRPEPPSQPPLAPEFNPDANVAAPIPTNVPVHPLEAAPQRQQPPMAVPVAPPAAQAQSPQPRLFPGLLDEMQAPVAEPRTEPPTLILMPLDSDDELTEPVAAPPVVAPNGERPFAAARQQRQELKLDELLEERPPTLNAPSLESDPLDNPFPELTENVADQRTGPYSGMELELDPFAEPAPTAAQPAADDDNPFAPFVERRAGTTINVQPRLPQVDELGPTLQGPGLPSEPGALPSIEPRQLPTTTQSAGTLPQAGHSPEVQNKLARIAARRGLTGLKGFCPVILRDHRDLEDARAEFTVIYDGKQYWFSSEQAKQSFLQAPEAYAPVSGGVDLVHFQNTGEQLEGSLDHAAWYQGRLHLFSSAENKAAFVASPRNFSRGE